ncbi:hypothetical protein ABPG72_012390 [Tetrahymena utriculariae]
MRKKQQNLIGSVVVLALIFSCQLKIVAAQENIKLNLEQDAYGTLKKGETQTYVLNLEKKQKEDQYLIITAEGTFEGSEPDIYVNIKEQKNLQKSKVICKSYGFTLCHIKGMQIDFAQELYVTVKCQTKCGYELVTFLEESTSQINMRLNDITYAIFEDSQGNLKDDKLILNRVVQMKFGPQDLPPKESLENMVIEFELMNPIQSYTTFNVYFNFNERVPTKTQSQSLGLNWGSGAGLGVLLMNKKSGLQSEGVYTMTIEAHEGALIAIRAIGWGEVRYIKPFQLVGGFTQSNSPTMKYQLNIDDQVYSDFKGKDLIIGLVPFQGDPNLYADTRSFSDLQNKNLGEYQWVSEEMQDDRITITAKELQKNSTINIAVNSKDNFSLFTMRAYYHLGKTPLSFDYPESGTLIAGELITYSLSLYGTQKSNVTLVLKPREGSPGLLMKRCNLDEKEKCVFTQEDKQSAIKSKFTQEPVIQTFFSDPDQCSQYKIEGLQVCQYLIGVYNTESDKDAKFTLLANNGLTHTILQENEIYHQGAEFGKINFFKLDLEKYTGVTQVSFQLSSVKGQVSMFASFDNIRPTVNSKIKQSFDHSLHLYVEEFGDLNKVIYLGIQSDSSFASYDIQAKITQESNFSFYLLEENQPLVVTEDASKVKKIHFKLLLRKPFNKELEVKVMLEPLSGYYDMKIGTTLQSIDLVESSNNILEFSSKLIQFERYEQPIYGIITPRMTFLNNKIQFKLSYVTSAISHQTLNLGMVNQIKVTQEEQYYKIPIQSNESVFIYKNVLNQFGDQDEVTVIVSYDQANVQPKKGEATSMIVPNFIPQIIPKEDFELSCKRIKEFSVDQNNCFLFVSVQAKKEATLLLYAEINSNAQFIFSDFPNTVAFKPQTDKKLYYPELFNKTFNLFKSSSFNGDELMICAKIFNNTLSREEWKYPVNCQAGDYDFKFRTQEDENFFYEIQDNNGVCNFDKRECGILIFLKDTSFKIWEITDLITLILQQSHTTIHPNQSIIDTLPPNGARFYYIELSEVKNQRFIVAATEQTDESLELILYIDREQVYSTNKNLPYIIFDKQFRDTLKNTYKFNDNSQFGLEVKSRIKDKNVKYSLLLTVNQDNEKSFTNVSLGQSQQINLKDNQDYQYFVFKNKAKGQPFKIIQSQQTQGHTQITVALLHKDTKDNLPLNNYIAQTYENVIEIREKQDECEKQCSYIIQLRTTEKSGASLALSVQRQVVSLLENILQQNELNTSETFVYNFSTLNKSTLSIDVQIGSLYVNITNSNGKEIMKDTLSKSVLHTFELPELQNSNQQYSVSITALAYSKFNIKYVNENTFPMISFDTPLKEQKFIPQQSKIYSIQMLGDKAVNIQISYTYDGKYEEGVHVIEDTYESDNKIPILSNVMSDIYDPVINLYIRHLQLKTSQETRKILMTLKNTQKNDVKKLSIYLSQSFTILDEGVPTFFYFDDEVQYPSLFGVILPEKERKLYIEITCLKGDLHSVGTYQRDSAINDKFQFTFTYGTRQVLDVDVSTGNFYIKIRGLAKYSQGFIKFVSFPSRTKLPTLAFHKPALDLPKITGVKSLEKWNEYTHVNFQFEPLDCSDYKKDQEDFFVQNIMYTLLISKDKQIIEGTDMKFSQIPDDFLSIEQKLNLFLGTNVKVPVLFLSFNESAECLNSCAKCQKKETSVPLESETFQKHLNDGTPFVIVRASIDWKHRVNGQYYTQNIYYSKALLDRSQILVPIKEVQDQPTPEGIPVFAIAIIIVGALVLITLLIFYIKKYKQTAKRLNFELTDVRNIAGISQSQNTYDDPKMKHIPLDEEIHQ